MITLAIITIAAICAIVGYGAWTARADRAYLDWASDETDWRR